MHYKYCLLPLDSLPLYAATHWIKPNTINPQHLCFTIVLFVNLFQNTQFYPYYPFKIYFSVTVITQIFFLLQSLN